MVTYPIISTVYMCLICIILVVIIMFPKELVKNIIKTKKISFKINIGKITKIQIVEKVMWIIIIALMYVVNLRIMIPSNESQDYSSEVDILFAIDTTVSMDAIDNENENNIKRIDKVKQDACSIIEKVNGARYALITFDNSYRIVTPFTSNSTIITNSINSLKVMDIGHAQGSSINIAKEGIKAAIGNYDSGDRKMVLVMFSDGEITAENEKLKKFTDIKELIDGGIIMGYGKNGSLIKVDEQDTYYTYLKDTEDYLLDRSEYPYKRALSKIDEKNLKSIAQDLECKYVKMTGKTNIDEVIEEIETGVSKKMTETSIYSAKDTYYYYVYGIEALLVIQFILYRLNKKGGTK